MRCRIVASNVDKMDPLYGVYSTDQKKFLDTVVIKYSYLAEKYETFEAKKSADLYIMCKEETDTFYTYRDYSVDELYAVGINDASQIAKYTRDDGYLQIPASYHNILLKNRRKAIIQNYVEQNNYYRVLNGYPPIETPQSQYIYIDDVYAEKYGIDKQIPIHQIQDYYNNITPGKGDYLISIIEGIGLLNNIKELHPDYEYLKYIGSARIDLITMRKAKNFQLIYAKQSTTSNTLYEEFIRAYEQARDYHVSTIFVREHRDIIPHYDQFIALCIMTMTLQLVINKQLKLGIDRKYYGNYTLRFLYDAYGIPYNLDIDEYTQRGISQAINTLIQKKSTDSVFHDIVKLLGFNDLNIYRYYLTKERKFDRFGAPIIATTTKFNNDTGEIEEVPDYKQMYDVYFQKVGISDTNFMSSYNIIANIEDYEDITSNDPFWWNDENINNAVWETEYNFVDTKYLSVGLSYKMTEIMYENIILLKFIANSKDELSDIIFTLPKINEDISVNLFDAVILLFCLMAKKHNLRGEIIYIPSQVASVLDYLRNTENGDTFFDCFSFDISMFSADNAEGQKLINAVARILDDDDAERFMSFIKSLSSPDLKNNDKITLINKIFTDIKGLSKYLQYLMTKTADINAYETLKVFYETLFYSKEVKTLFTINEDNLELKRTAMTYFEYLYHYNPKLYHTVFTPDFEGQYNTYMTNNTDKDSDTYTLDQYIHDVEYGKIEDFTYSTLLKRNTEGEIEDDVIYYYIDHIISRMEIYIENLKYIYIANDSTTPLEDLMVRLINFFKSFTVDMLGVDAMYILDFRIENTMKLIDSIHEICKNIEINDKLPVSYADIVKSMIAYITDNNDKLSIFDKVLYDVYIRLIKDQSGNNLNMVRFIDLVDRISSSISVVSEPSYNILQFTDYIHMESNVICNDKSKQHNLLRDEIAQIYYTDNDA